MKRTTSQVTGDQGEATALFIAAKNKDWIARKMDKDFGVDLEMELVANGIVTGQYVKLQIKGTRNYKVIDNKIKFRIGNDFLKYCDECRVPIILVLVDVANDRGFYLWVQEYIRIYQVNYNMNKTQDVYFSASNDFAFGLINEIKLIASGLSFTQLQLDLKACLTSAFLLGNEEVYGKLAELALDVAKTNELEINKIIDDLIILGVRAWGSTEGNRKANILYNFCRTYGDKFLTAHIYKMVSRGSSYSRVGIIALGILYDEYPMYIKSLQLPILFKSHFDIRIRYYCLLRERYVGMKSLELSFNKTIDYKIDNLYIPEMDKLDLYLKWPNRGDSSILDYLVCTDDFH